MKVAELLGQQVDERLYREDTSLVSNDDGVGVEVELENVTWFGHDRSYDYPNIFGLWKAVEDGSLRNGTEYIFRDALKGANITAALSLLQSFIDVYRNPNNNEPIKLSERCSVHVHCDVRDLDDIQLNNLILIYMMIERVLFTHINPLRSKNNYCRPLTDSNFKYTITNMNKGAPRDKLIILSQIVRRDCDKYSALNVLPITKYGSVEFRHHHGCTDMDKIKEWINIILSIKLKAKDTSPQELIDLYHEKGAYKLVKAICKDTVLDDKGYLESLEEFELMVAKGINDVTEILISDSLLAMLPKSKSRVKPENSLLNKFKEANGLSVNASDEFNG